MDNLKNCEKANAGSGFARFLVSRPPRPARSKKVAVYKFFEPA